MPSDEPIQLQLEIARRDLLDLSTRNRLRLDNIGLGDMCLELHSKMASKNTVVNEIDRTLK